MEIFALNEYRTSLALNNCGVGLLRQGAYDEAIETFSDAVHVLSQVMRDNHCGITEEISRNAQERLQKASQVFSHVSSKTRVESRIDVLTFNDISSMRLLSIMERCGGRPVAVRIEDVAGGNRSSDIEASIMLHNLACAHYHASKAVSDENRELRLKEASIRLSLIASQVISKVLASESEYSEVYMRASRVTILVTSAYICHLQHAGQMDQARNIYNHLILFQCELLDDFSTDCIHPAVQTYAPAA